MALFIVSLSLPHSIFSGIHFILTSFCVYFFSIPCVCFHRRCCLFALKPFLFLSIPFVKLFSTSVCFLFLFPVRSSVEGSRLIFPDPNNENLPPLLFKIFFEFLFLEKSLQNKNAKIKR